MREKDLVANVTIKHQAVGTEATKAAVNSVTDAVKGLGNATEATGAKQETAARRQASALSSFEKLERSVSPAARALADYERAQKLVGRAVDQNAALQERGAAVLQVYRDRLTATGAASVEAAKGTGLARHELINLSRQAQDLAVSLGSGQSFGTVLLQQGTQIADVFSNSTGTMKGFFGQIAAGAGSVLTTTALSFSAVVGLTAAAAALALQYDKVQKSSERALIGAGARTGTTIGDINTFTEQNTGGAGGGLSNKEARKLAEDLTSTGDIVISKLHGMSDAVVGFANKTDQSMADASKAMVQFANDPMKALQELSKVYGDFDAKTRKSVESFTFAGDKTSAFNAILDAMSDKSRKAAESAGILEDTWRRVVNVLAKDAVKPSGLEDQIKDAEARLKLAVDTAPNMLNPADGARNVELITAELKKLNAELIRTNPAAQTAAAGLNKLSADANSVTDAILPQIAKIKELDAAITKLAEAKAAGAPSTRGAEADDGALAVLQQQKALQQDSLATVIRQAEVVKSLQAAWGGVSAQTALTLNNLQDQLGVAQAVTGAERITAQEIATRNNLLAQGVAIEEARSIAGSERSVSEAAATADVERQTQSLKDQDELLRARQNGYEAPVAAAIAYRNAIASGADETAAAALRSETLKNNMLKAASATQQMASAVQQVADAGSTSFAGGSILTSGASAAEGGWVHEFDGSTSVPNGPRGEFSAAGGLPASVFTHQLQTADDIINASLSGGPDSALAKLKNAQVESWRDAPGGGDINKLLGRDTSRGPIDSAVNQLYQLKLAIAGDNKEGKEAVYRDQLAWLQQQPMTISNMRSIVDLQRAMKDLTEATEANTEASLNPLYSEGRSALRIGYYKAATGLEGIVGGTGGTDSTPVHMMLTPGEHIKVTAPGQTSNDNSKTIINNVTNVFGGSPDTTRRSMRQAGQSFAQMIAAAS